MNQRTLSRQISTSVVEALKAHGHILIVKGGVEALVREIDGIMGECLAIIAPRLERRAIVGEVTSTFGDETADETVEDMVGQIAKAMMESEHVEDVFAEDHVIQRDIFRIVREALLRAPPEAVEEEEEEAQAPISVRLETLGYVAATVAKRADAETLRDALERAALAAEGELSAYDANAREASFSVPSGDPDARLEIEEAVADELADLVDMGLVDLPTIERKVALPREVAVAERPALKPQIEAVVAKTLRRAGCAATWEFAGPQTLAVSFTPLSEQDGQEVDPRVADFAREIASLLGRGGEIAAPPPAPTADREALRRGAETLLDLAKGRQAPTPSRAVAKTDGAGAEPKRADTGAPAAKRATKAPAKAAAKPAATKVSAPPAKAKKAAAATKEAKAAPKVAAKAAPKAKAKPAATKKR